MRKKLRVERLKLSRLNENFSGGMSPERNHRNEL
jgi:hypothetical protein